MAMASNAATPKPFRFLDLPKDIRLMVYERLTRSTDRLTVGVACCEERLTLISHSVSTAILRTCHEVHQEALPLVNKAIREWVRNGGVKIICPSEYHGLGALQELLKVLCYIWETRLSKSQLTHSATALDDDTKSDIRTNICNLGYLWGNDMDRLCAWVAKSALIMDRQQRAMGAALPSVDILLSPKAPHPLKPIRDERHAYIQFMRLVQRDLVYYDVGLNIVGFISPEHLELDCSIPYLCDWQRTWSDDPIITTEEWYRIWK